MKKTLKIAFALLFFCLGSFTLSASQNKLPAESLPSTTASDCSLAEEKIRIKGLFGRIEALEAELNKNIAELKKAEATLPSAEALSAENAFLDSVNAEILKAVSAFENVGTGRTPYKYTLDMEDSTKIALSATDRAFHLIFFPRSPRSLTVEIPSANGGVKRLEGLSARIGPVMYFHCGRTGEAFAFAPADAKRISSVFGTSESEWISEYFSGRAKELPPPFLLEENPKNLAQMSVWERIEAGGIWMAPILVFGFLALFIAAVKSVKVIAIRRAPEDAAEKISSLLESGDADAALKAAKNAPQPYSAMLISLVRRFKNGATAMEESAYEHMLIEGGRLHKGLGLISITATVAPLLGLLGTVTGIIKTFGNISEFGTGNAGLMSRGIGEALITTEFGLIVAIPAFVVHALLSRKIKAVLADMEKLASGILNAAK